MLESRPGEKLSPLSKQVLRSKDHVRLDYTIGESFVEPVPDLIQKGGAPAPVEADQREATILFMTDITQSLVSGIRRIEAALS